MADITGQALLHVLYEQLMKYHEQIDRYEEWFVTALVQDDQGDCCGAIARNIRDGSMEVFAAKATILASGGAGQCFKPTTNALICTGDGIAQGYRIGAPLMDMEMIQYHPTTLAGNGILITEGARGEGAHLYNAVATVGSFVLAISYLVFRSQKAKPTLGKEGLIGEIGEARTKLAPTGRIFVHGEHWGAEADSAVESGEKVRVIGYDGMRLKVTRVAEGGDKN